MKLTLLRHGQTYENLKRITQGQLNTQLTNLGIEQAKKVAEALKDKNFDFIISSDLDRTMNTAKEIIQYYPELNIIPEKRLREQNKGPYQGQPSDVTHQAIINFGGPYHKFDHNGGESYLDVRERVVELLNEHEEKYFDKNVLWVTHGGVIINTLLHALNEPFEKSRSFAPKNTAVSVINIDKDNFEVELINSTEHLDN